MWGLLAELRRLVGEEVATRGPAKKPVNRYFQQCMKRKKDDEYCARVAWSIYCAHKNPGYKGCTKYGKKWGKPYSAPVD